MRLQKISSLFLSVLFVTNYTFAVPIVPPSNDKLYEVITTGDVQTMKSFIDNHLVTQTRTVFDANDFEMTMLSLAVQHQQPKIVKLLLNRLHVDPNLDTDDYDWLPLEDAIRIHDELLLRSIPTNTQMIKLLVQAGANINYFDPETNQSLLHIAQDPEVVQYLLVHGAHPNEQIVETGNTPLLDACLSAKFQKAMILLKNKANPSIPNNERKTALHILAAINTQYYNPDQKEELFALVKKLLDVGVDPFKFDIHGKTAAQIAQENNNIEMVKFLRSHSAFIPHKIAEESLFKSTLLHAVQQYYEGNPEYLKEILKNASETMLDRLEIYLTPSFLHKVKTELNS